MTVENMNWKIIGIIKQIQIVNDIHLRDFLHSLLSILPQFAKNNLPSLAKLTGKTEGHCYYIRKALLNQQLIKIEDGFVTFNIDQLSANFDEYMAKQRAVDQALALLQNKPLAENVVLFRKVPPTVTKETIVKELAQKWGKSYDYLMSKFLNLNEWTIIRAVTKCKYLSKLDRDLDNLPNYKEIKKHLENHNLLIVVKENNRYTVKINFDELMKDEASYGN